MARANDFWRKYCQPEIHAVERWLSWLSSLHLVGISGGKKITERASCSAAFDKLIEERKGRIEMRATSFLRPKCLYARFTSAVCLVSAAAAAEWIAGVRTQARLDDTSIGYGQPAKKYRIRGNINQKRDHFPLATHASDLEDGRSPAIVDRGAGAAGSVGVSLSVVPVPSAPVTRVVPSLLTAPLSLPTAPPSTWPVAPRVVTAS